MSIRQPARPNLRRNQAKDLSLPRNVRHILIVAVPPMRTLDVFGPAEVFGDANWLRGGDPAYKVNIISACADRVVSNHLGTPVHTDRTYPGIFRADRYPPGCGCMGPRELHYEPGFLEWLRLQSGTGSAVRLDLYRRVCAGKGRPSRRTARDNALELGDANSPKTTRAWLSIPTRFIFAMAVAITSAGVTAGIDLCLALVEQDLGRPLALRIAQMMVVFLRRPGGQSQFSATLEAQIGENHPLGDLLAWLPDHLRQDLSVDSLARRLAMSARNFARLFKQEIGKTPGEHIEDLRLEAARRQLESTSQSTDEVADACGLASAEVLRRLFRRRLQVTPGQYRTSFGQTEVLLQPHRGGNRWSFVRVMLAFHLRCPRAAQ